MKKSIILVAAGLMSAASASYAADITSVTLTSSNASNASVDTYYKWVNTDVLVGTAAITFSESNLALLANRFARDWSGSATLAADSDGNYVKVGSTAASNVLGLGVATITGENTNTFLTFTSYSDSTYNAGFSVLFPELLP